MSASGNYMPTTFVFPSQRTKQELLDDAPPGTTAEYHPSGWMQKDIFVKWLQRFVEFSEQTEEKPVLLLLDGHSTHRKSTKLTDTAQNNNVILCLPPHCTHRLQSLHVSFMAPLNHYCSEEVRKCLRSHPGRVVTINQIGKLYGSAFMKAASIETAVNGFRKTAILSSSPSKKEHEDLKDKSKAKRRIISTDNKPAKKKRRSKKKKTTKKCEKDIKMMIQRHLMEETTQLPFFVMNCFQSPNQEEGGLNPQDAMDGRTNIVQELMKKVMISRTSVIYVAD
jgi:hypothetical protein